MQCCSVFQCVAVCCSVFYMRRHEKQYVCVCGCEGVWVCVFVCVVLQYRVVSCIVLQCLAAICSVSQCFAVIYNVLQFVALWRSLQRVRNNHSEVFNLTMYYIIKKCKWCIFAKIHFFHIHITCDMYVMMYFFMMYFFIMYFFFPMMYSCKHHMNNTCVIMCGVCCFDSNTMCGAHKWSHISVSQNPKP